MKSFKTTITPHHGTHTMNMWRKHPWEMMGTLGSTFCCTRLFLRTYTVSFLQRQRAILDSHNAWAILESQFLSIKKQIISVLPENAPPLERLVVTGGGSVKLVFCQLAANVFRMDIYIAETKEVAGIGGALPAQFAWWHGNQKSDGNFEELKVREGEKLKLEVEPRPGQVEIYEGLVDRYTKCKTSIVSKSAST
jgi:sugar (pentulose or hexulose) kinase